MPKYEVRENDKYEIDDDHFITITEGKFLGTDFVFGELRFQGQDEEGNGRIAFDYDLLSLGEGITLNDENQHEFEQDLSNVLRNIMTEIFAQEENETRDADTEPTDLL